ncbi:MAG: hypothetical protein GY835_09485 [bacterium]|nr:hypothetical protein [bacterium]
MKYKEHKPTLKTKGQMSHHRSNNNQCTQRALQHNTNRKFGSGSYCHNWTGFITDFKNGQKTSPQARTDVNSKNPSNKPMNGYAFGFEILDHAGQPVSGCSGGNVVTDLTIYNGYDAGHILARAHGGDGTNVPQNIFAQDPGYNRGLGGRDTWKNVEHNFGYYLAQFGNPATYPGYQAQWYFEYS